jgi:GntR family transcriptional regulator
MCSGAARHIHPARFGTGQFRAAAALRSPKGWIRIDVRLIRDTNSTVQVYRSSDTVIGVKFRLKPTNGQPLYLQLMQQIRHGVESGGLQDGDQLPGIRTLAEELVVSPNTVAKAYSELEHEGVLELRQGSGAFILTNRRTRYVTDRMESARKRVGKMIEQLREEGLLDDEIRRVFEAEFLMPEISLERKR